MKENQIHQYQRVAEAIEYIKANFRLQPSLDQIAEQVHLSPHHFQRIFTEWAGVSPKKFMQYISVEYAKSLLHQSQPTLFDVAQQTGLSGTGRLHDLFVKIEAMTPGEYKARGAQLVINYHFASSPFGQLMIASTEKGVCYMAFEEDRDKAFFDLKARFPQSVFQEKMDAFQEQALLFFQKGDIHQIKLHLKGSAFQLKVWEALLRIPEGKLSTYQTIAREIDQPQAARAVGTAIGSNPVAILIPCHRVIQSSGNMGGYMWGITRKTAIIGWEAAQVNNIKS